MGSGAPVASRAMPWTTTCPAASSAGPAVTATSAVVVASPAGTAASVSACTTSPGRMSGVSVSQQTPPGWLTSKTPAASAEPLAVPTTVPLRTTLIVSA